MHEEFLNLNPDTASKLQPWKEESDTSKKPTRGRWNDDDGRTMFQRHAEGGADTLVNNHWWKKDTEVENWGSASAVKTDRGTQEETGS